ncbi:MAG: aspartate aminotransferase family protein [Anaerolineales bacterium]|nr:aspartate aminotransferase family protein [Anaerolineales bacterium]
MNAQEIIQTEAKYVLQSYVRPEVVFSHGEGAYLVDTEGKKYLDFASGIAVTALGHADKEWATAVSEQAHKLTHVSNLYHSEPHALLAKRLVENSFADRVLFCNSGAEANEGALKFARKWAKMQDGNKTKIIAFSGGFHGRTMGSLSATYKEQYRAPFGPLVPDVVFVKYNDLEAAAAAIDDNTCAVIVEPVQGEGGVNPATAVFLQGLRDLCNQYHAALIFDEVQCGLGRTGKLWGYQHFDVTPDIMTLAKPLAGGLPIGAVLTTQAIADAIKPGDHGSTFAAGPLVCHAANVVFDRVSQPAFLEQVAHTGAYLRHRLETLETEEIVEVRGMGLLVGVEMKTAVSPLIAAARAKGLLIISAGENIVRMAPPLIIGESHVNEAVGILEACLEGN